MIGLALKLGGNYPYARSTLGLLCCQFHLLLYHIGMSQKVLSYYFDLMRALFAIEAAICGGRRAASSVVVINHTIQHPIDSAALDKTVTLIKSLLTMCPGLLKWSTGEIHQTYFANVALTESTVLGTAGFTPYLS